MSSIWAKIATATDTDAEMRATLESSWRAFTSGHAVLLSTCHRVELYGIGGRPPSGAGKVIRDGDAVEHLFGVAAGLESAILGETEVLGQVRGAIGQARLQHRLDPVLDRLFDCAVHTGRMTRANGTPVAASLADVAVEWLLRRRTSAGRPVLVVGTGAMGRALVSAATARSVNTVVAGRDRLGSAAELVPKVCGIAVALRGPWRELDDLPRRLPPTVDLSAPPAVGASVRDALGDSFAGIDDFVTRHESLPAWVYAARGIVEAESISFVRWAEDFAARHKSRDEICSCG